MPSSGLVPSLGNSPGTQRIATQIGNQPQSGTPSVVSGKRSRPSSAAKESEARSRLESTDEPAPGQTMEISIPELKLHVMPISRFAALSFANASSNTDETLVAVPTMKNIIDNARNAIRELVGKIDSAEQYETEAGKRYLDAKLRLIESRIYTALDEREKANAKALEDHRHDLESKMEMTVFSSRSDLREERERLVEELISNTRKQNEEKLTNLIAQGKKMEEKYIIDVQVLEHMKRRKEALLAAIKNLRQTDKDGGTGNIVTSNSAQVTPSSSRFATAVTHKTNTNKEKTAIHTMKLL